MAEMGIRDSGTIQVPSMGELQAQIGGAGYARGTRSATPGWRWVGENGPELMLSLIHI